MQIKVIYSDGATGWVESGALDDLIDRREIIAFERSNGLAWIARDPIRRKRRSGKESDRFSST
ncbi:GSU3473 family protein [Geobacter sp. DSM 9736]|uniref:GSU3473 family protein n=1 Tax=Geobacter sp. DSM 9736 TaxID=1277350 RepID=UPI000B503B1A|nr:hypothetical protein [Geobacter sp. DSM 9736]SNB44975.1 hypothetical protein SAMN06269301_0367 [Geobacter sp. DSM 9736]